MLEQALMNMELVQLRDYVTFYQLQARDVKLI